MHGTNPEPKDVDALEKIKSELEDVLKKHDCGGCVIFSKLSEPPVWDQTMGPKVGLHGVVLYVLSPSYSRLVMNGEGVSLDMRGASQDAQEELLRLAPTVAMLQALATLAQNCTGVFTEMADMATGQTAFMFETAMGVAQPSDKSGMH